MKEIRQKIQCCLLSLGLCLSAEATSSCDTPSPPYSREAFSYNVDNLDKRNVIGFYTGARCDRIEFDHVVSLKDAWLTGAWQWDDDKRSRFANDQLNLVPACASVNRSKGASTPSNFLRKSRDGRGLDYDIIGWKKYLNRYRSVKRKYGLSFCNNQSKFVRLTDN